MKEPDGHLNVTTGEQPPSPTEQLEGEAASVPGVENPESEEIKQEVNPNTE